MIDSKYIIALIVIILIAGITVYFTFIPKEDAIDSVVAHGAIHTSGSMMGHLGSVGNYTTADFDPDSYLKSWNFNNLAPQERSKYYRESKLSDNTTLREYWIYASDKKIEVAPGVFFDAWA
jgi:hypothetical protein